MCQLFALSSDTPTTVNFSFTGFSARGGQTGPHGDGFGMALHGPQGNLIFHDEMAASRSPLAAFLRRQPIRATTVLAHIRKATRGAVRLENCHPFQRRWRGRTWSFCHNGHLKDFHPDLPEAHQPLGQTDSEAAFGWLLHQLDQALPSEAVPDAITLAPLLQPLASEAARHGPFNFLLSDGELTYAYCSTRLSWLERRPPFGRVALIDVDLSLDLSHRNRPGHQRVVLIATEPLTRDEPWQAMQAGELMVLRQGRRLLGACA